MVETRKDSQRCYFSFLQGGRESPKRAMELRLDLGDFSTGASLVLELDTNVTSIFLVKKTRKGSKERRPGGTYPPRPAQQQMTKGSSEITT